MKHIIKNSLRITALSVASVLLFASCSDWTDPEGLDVKTPSVDSKLYADYLANLKAYKAGAHKVLFVTFENSAETPSGQSEHLSTLPDSVDFISLKNPDNLNAQIVKEMSDVRKKGTRVIYDIDYSVFEVEWVQITKETPGLTEEDALAYFTSRTEEMLALYDKWGYDGLTASYLGRSLVSLTEADKAVYNARQQAFLNPIAAWRATHSESAFTFIGNPHFLVEENRGFLAECDYIVLPTDAASNAEDITMRALTAVGNTDVPSDRIVVTALSVRPNDEKQQYGYFGSVDEAGNRVRAVYGCARWMNQPASGFTRAGLLIRDVQYDYFDPSLVYSKTREAIGIMNPSPKN